ncbi:unnamed protein product [Prunus armeniaca]|uniref:Uncharacterized protein n=1 Tax=Prunus armeniaca TaxID=36596 RepID=A0A6J5YDJ2_PRUAR|nr:unnamed protein product [Prunus armeniaca]
MAMEKKHSKQGKELNKTWFFKPKSGSALVLLLLHLELPQKPTRPKHQFRPRTATKFYPIGHHRWCFASMLF